jgi:rhodanese-related sulfurtransferase
MQQRLALLALLLAALALFGDPTGGGAVTVNTRELARIVETEVDHVTAEELADWIIQGRTDYRLIDLREPADYAAYHIPTAENATVTELEDYPLYRNERIVLYSNGGIHSAQAWFLLRARGFQGVYMLLGGLTAWKEDVLFPVLPENPAAEQMAELERMRQVAELFGGSARTASGETMTGAETELPTVAAPVAPTIVNRPAKKRRKEGC